MQPAGSQRAATQAVRLPPRRFDRLAGPVALAVGLVLGLAMIEASAAVSGLEGGVAKIAALLPIGYAFAAGMVATVNPCGVLLLPSLVAYYLGQGAPATVSGWKRAGRALVLGLMATLGFVAIFAVVGAAMSVGGHALGNAFPVGGMLVGVALAGLGAWVAVTGRDLGLLAASRAMGRVRLGGAGSLFVFGVAYAIASLACTLPIFLVVVGSALAATGALNGLLQFVGYALGMGVMLSAVILGAAFFQGLVARWIRRIVPYVHRVAAAFLIGAGLYLLNYWLTVGRAFG